MIATLTGAILPGVLCAAELIAVWRATHSAADILSDAPALDGVAVLAVTLI